MGSFKKQALTDRKKVLIVENDPSAQEFWILMLERLDPSIEIACTSSATEAAILLDERHVLKDPFQMVLACNAETSQIRELAETQPLPLFLSADHRVR